MLYSQSVENQHHDSTEANNQVIPVFLHGFLGCSRDWQACLPWLNSPHSIQVDLPCHGSSKYCEVEDFTAACQQVQLTIVSQLKKQGLSAKTPLVLIGYSLGARIAMYGLSHTGFSKLSIQGAIIEGGNFGLQQQTEIEARWQSDKMWSKRFATEGMEDVLYDWYLQGVFAGLTDAQREHLVQLRCDNLGSQVGCMMRATSLAKQPYLLPELKKVTIPLLYLCGERDTKFSQLAQSSGLDYQIVPQAGHNVHIEQPQCFAEIINQFILQCHASVKQ